MMPSCFAISFELQCVIRHLTYVTRGITYAYNLNTYCHAWKAVHMLSLAVDEKINCILCRQPSARTPHGTTPSYGPPYTSVVFTREDIIAMVDEV